MCSLARWRPRTVTCLAHSYHLVLMIILPMMTRAPLVRHWIQVLIIFHTSVFCRPFVLLAHRSCRSWPHLPPDRNECWNPLLHQRASPAALHVFARSTIGAVPLQKFDFNAADAIISNIWATFKGFAIAALPIACADQRRSHHEASIQATVPNPAQPRPNTYTGHFLGYRLLLLRPRPPSGYAMLQP